MDVGCACITQRITQFLSHLEPQSIDQKQDGRTLVVADSGSVDDILKKVSLLQLGRCEEAISFANNIKIIRPCIRPARWACGSGCSP